MAGRSMYQLTNVDKAGCLTQVQWVREQTGKLIVPAIFLWEQWHTGAPYVTAYRVSGEVTVNGAAWLADGSSAESFRSRLGFVLATESLRHLQHGHIGSMHSHGVMDCPMATAPGYREDGLMQPLDSHGPCSCAIPKRHEGQRLQVWVLASVLSGCGLPLTSLWTS